MPQQPVLDQITLPIKGAGGVNQFFSDAQKPPNDLNENTAVTQFGILSRLPGKKLANISPFSSPIIGIFLFNKCAIVQTRHDIIFFDEAETAELLV